jgi:predicted DNA-binding protein (MmcQ/YjbR family)
VVEGIRKICRALPGTTEDVKWGSDLVFSVGGKMFTVVCLDPPHTVAFKCTPETFADLIEREGVIPAPYLARAMWVQERAADVVERRELKELIRASYDLVVAGLPKTKRPADPSSARKESLPRPRGLSRSSAGRPPGKSRGHRAR